MQDNNDDEFVENALLVKVTSSFFAFPDFFNCSWFF